ncbi:polymerase delta-interacting protein 3-like isoform X1 [Arapaima gigas]
MADVSLDEVIRRRGLNNNTRSTPNRPGFYRGVGVVGGTFDARQKIGVSDVRQRLSSAGAVFQVKDAREKLSQKDAYFRLRSGVSGGAVQDARQMINSRKQQGPKLLRNTAQSLIKEILQVNLQTDTKQTSNSANKPFPNVNRSTHLQRLNSKVKVELRQVGGSKKETDPRERLSLKRSIAVTPSTGSVSSFKITKTVQQRPVGMTSAVHVNIPSSFTPSLSSEDVIPSKQMKITASGSALHKQPSSSPPPFSLSGPITKVVQNDNYTAPPPVAVAALRPSISSTDSCYTPPDLPPVSRTLITSQAQHSTDNDETTLQTSTPTPAFSPLEGTKMTVNNLHSRVTEEDIIELFCVCGALKRARLLCAGVAEVVFVRKEDAIAAYRKYNNRCLDGQPMKCNLHIQGNVISSEQPILLRLSDTPGSSSSGAGVVKKVGLPPSLSRPSGRSNSFRPAAEVDPQTILKALFKSSTPAPLVDSASTQSTAFCIKI